MPLRMLRQVVSTRELSKLWRVMVLDPRELTVRALWGFMDASC